MSQYVVIALYKFVDLEDFESMRQPLLDFCKTHSIKGTLILAREGINGTVAGSRQNIDALLAYFKSDSRLADIGYKESFASKAPFYRMKVHIKPEIVTLGMPEINPNKKVGKYIPPTQWNELISQPDVILIDTRNSYEYEVGTFQGAVDPKTETFREFPEYVDNALDPEKHRKVAMFCTGGIRCEKATALMLEKGFEEVYHLEGGILKYLEDIPPEESLWQGECFVFDNRVSVGHGVEEGTYDLCHGCRMPLAPDDKTSTAYEAGVSCPRCIEELTDEKKMRLRERQHQINLAKKRNQQHIGAHTA